MRTWGSRGFRGMLAAALVVCLAACSSAAAAPEPAAAGSSEGNQEGAAVVSAGAEGEAASKVPEAMASEESEEFVPAFDTQTEGAIMVAGHYNNFEALEEEFNRFNEYYPNVELTYTFLDNYNGIISTALGSAEAPDIFFTFPWMAAMEEYKPVMEAAEDLSDPSLGIDLSCIRSNLLYTDDDGRIPMVPVYTTTYGMMVNEDLFAKENVDIPKTYAELIDACMAFKEAGYESPVMGYNESYFLIYPLFYPYFCALILNDETAVREMNDMKPEAGEYMRPALELAADFMSHGCVDLDSCNMLEDDYNAVIMRFFEGDVPMMMATGNTVSGTRKRESQSEAFSARPFEYSFRPVPSTEDGGYFLNTISMLFSVNKNSQNLDMANEFMRFLVRTDELNRMAMAKRMVTPCIDMTMDDIYTAFGEVADSHFINSSDIGVESEPGTQVTRAGWLVSNGILTVDEAVERFGTME